MIPDYPTPDLSVQLRNLWKISFHDDDVFLDHFFRTGFSPDRCRCMVNEAGRLLSVLYWFDTEYEGETFAYLYAVATDPEYRRQGLLRYLMEDTKELLKSRGYAGILLVPGDDSLRQMYRTMGFETCTTVSTVICTSQPETIPIHAVDREEYGRLRRARLPQNGLIQEKENLAFLETQCRFYAGPGFVLCASPKDEETLEAPEFLGDAAAIPGILCSLGYPMGSFRMPGTAIPFAMVSLLKKDIPAPGYLGLAFD